jgi:hypothetical protein
MSVDIARLGSTLKFQRAYQHFVNTEAAVSEFLASKPYRISRDEESELGKLRFWVTLLEEPPPVISLVAGDAIHNMRSSLDHIIFERSSKKMVDPKRTAFPVQTTEDDWDKRNKHGALQTTSGKYQVRYLPDAAQTLVHNLQPCPRPEIFKPDMFGPNRKRLKQLHDFDIAHKHKSLNVAVACLHFAGIGHDATPRELFPHFEHFHQGPLDLNTPTLLVQLSRVPEMDVEPVLAPQIAFSEGTTPGEPIDRCLRELLVCVEMILNALRRFLGPDLCIARA